MLLRPLSDTKIALAAAQSLPSELLHLILEFVETMQRNQRVLRPKIKKAVPKYYRQ